MEKYQIEQEAKTHLVKTLTAKIRDGQKDYDDIDAYISKIKKYVQIEKLDREMLLTLIKEITVGEVKIENGQKTQNVGIYYNYLS